MLGVGKSLGWLVGVVVGWSRTASNARPGKRPICLPVISLQHRTDFKSKPNRVDGTMDRGRPCHTGGDLSAVLGPVSGIGTCQRDWDSESHSQTFLAHAPSHFPAKKCTKVS